VQWLAAVAPDLTVECHEYQLYRQGGQLLVSFQRLFPVGDLENRRLRPIVAAATAEVREQLVTNQRRAKSVTIIHQHQLIPDGAHMALELETLVKADLVQQVSGWLAAGPVRSGPVPDHLGTGPEPPAALGSGPSPRMDPDGPP